MTDNPLTLESDEDGLYVMLDIRLLDDPEVRIDRQFGTAESVKGRISMSAALELYEHVQKELGGWHAEMMASRREHSDAERERFAREDEALVLDSADPKHPGYADALRDRADELCKRVGGDTEAVYSELLDS